MLFRAILEIFGAVIAVFTVYYLRVAMHRRLYCRIMSAIPHRRRKRQEEPHAISAAADQ